jgi:signal transduction histidine kinase
MLTALKMDLRWIEKKLAQPPDDARRAAAEQKIIGAEKLTDAIIETVQRIAAELRPRVLDNLGLSVALRHEANQFAERTGIRCRTSLPEDLPALEPAPTTALFRIFQEAVTNVARHSEASEFEVGLRVENGELVLEVKDNGKGISARAVSRPTSLGLLGMSERAAALGGRVYFQGAPGKGTRVTVRIPQRQSK